MSDDEDNGVPIRVGVVIPLANEISNVGRFADEVLRYIRPDDRLYCVLDRVSTDGTREAVEARAKIDPRVVYVWAPENRCLADAYYAGYRVAYAANCRWILEIDAGFSYPPEKIPEFITAMEAGYDFVCGSRFIEGGAHRSPWTRRLLSFGATKLTRLISGSQMTDLTGGFECFSRPAMECVLQNRVRSHGNFFHAEIRHMMGQFRWKEIPVVYLNDQYRVGRSALGESFRTLGRMGVKRLSQRLAPKPMADR
jgi:dolichol-phosphate mannosyltransferase